MSESKRPIILYMHGNTGSRAREHRVDQYVFLRKLGYHVVCFDYRGYADSSQDIPTKRGVVTDGHAMYNYVREYSGSSPVFVWGHSLGTAVASQVVANLCAQVRLKDHTSMSPKLFALKTRNRATLRTR